MPSVRALTSPFLRLFTLLSLAALVSFAGCGDNNPASSAKAITTFSFAAASNPGLTTDVAATINGTTIAATVPFGTDVTALHATFASTGATVMVGSVPQVSGVTSNNFTAPVTYTVAGADTSTTSYTVTVTVAPSSAKELTAFAFRSAANASLVADINATINGTAVAATVPYGTDVTTLVASFSSTGAHVTVGATAQVSGTTPNSFASPVAYTITAADSTTKIYTVTVSVAPNPAKEITAFELTSALNSGAGVSSDVTATISGTTIAATVPYGTDVTALVATFTTTGQSVAVGAIAQVSGTTANDFTAPVTYTVTAANGTTKQYTVTVTVALNPAKELTAFSLTSALNSGAGVSADVVATISGTSIGMTVPYGTDVTALIPTFSTTGASVAVAGTAQASGITPNDFTHTVVYTVTAADHTTKDYTVTVTVALNPAKDITSFGFTSALNSGAGISSDVVGTISGTTIGLTVPYGTNVTALVATFATTGASVTVATAAQASGLTANDFTQPVTYLVTAADGTTKSYSVLVTIALDPAKEITTFELTSALNAGAGVSADAVGTVSGQAIAVTVPYGTTPTALVASFTTTGASVAVGGTPQATGITANDFSAPVVYTVTAADGSTKDFTVTVTVALNPAKDLTSFGFTSALDGGAGVASDVVATITGTTITATVPYGTTLTALIPTFTTTGASVAVGATAQTSGVTANDFTQAVTYRVTAADGTTQDYTVTVSVALNPAKDLTSFEFTSALNGTAGVSYDAVGTITGTTIAVYVPLNTTMSSLVATFTTTGQTVQIGSTAQASGVTANDFTSPVTYRVTAADGTTQDYTVTVTPGAFATASLSGWSGANTKQLVFVFAPAGTQLNSNADYKAYCESQGFEQNQNSNTGWSNDYVTAGMYSTTDYYCSDYCCYLGDGNQEATALTGFQNYGLPLGSALQVFDRGCGDYSNADYNHGVVTVDTLITNTATSFTYNASALGVANYDAPKTTTFSQDGVVVCQMR